MSGDEAPQEAAANSSNTCQDVKKSNKQHRGRRQMEDSFMMYMYKVRMCNRTSTHNYKLCPWAHPGETAALRRHPSCHIAELCPAVRQHQECPHGEGCMYSRNIFECFLHPERYRTTMCSSGEACNRNICFFAHNETELRAPTASSTQPVGGGYGGPQEQQSQQLMQLQLAHMAQHQAAAANQQQQQLALQQQQQQQLQMQQQMAAMHMGGLLPMGRPMASLVVPADAGGNAAAMLAATPLQSPSVLLHPQVQLQQQQQQQQQMLVYMQQQHQVQQVQQHVSDGSLPVTGHVSLASAGSGAASSPLLTGGVAQASPGWAGPTYSFTAPLPTVRADSVAAAQQHQLQQQQQQLMLLAQAGVSLEPAHVNGSSPVVAAHQPRLSLGGYSAPLHMALPASARSGRGSLDIQPQQRHQQAVDVQQAAALLQQLQVSGLAKGGEVQSEPLPAVAAAARRNSLSLPPSAAATLVPVLSTDLGSCSSGGLLPVWGGGAAAAGAGAEFSSASTPLLSNQSIVGSDMSLSSSDNTLLSVLPPGVLRLERLDAVVPQRPVLPPADPGAQHAAGPYQPVP